MSIISESVLFLAWPDVVKLFLNFRDVSGLLLRSFLKTRFLIWPLIKILLSLSGYFVLFGIMIASFPCTDLFLDFIFKIKWKSTNANPTPRVNFRYRVYFIWHEMGDRPCHETPCQSNFWFLFSLFQFLLIKFNHIFVWFKINCGGAQRQSLHSWCEKWSSAHFWIKKLWRVTTLFAERYDYISQWIKCPITVCNLL